MDRLAEAHAINLFQQQLEPLREFFENPEIQEIMVNAPDNVWVERHGSMERVPGVKITDVNLRSAVRALANVNDKNVAAVLDCRMTGLRVAAAMHPVSTHGNAICIRKHTRSNRRLEDYLAAGAFDVINVAQSDAEMGFYLTELPPSSEDVLSGGAYLADMLRWMVRSRQNILIAGSTSSGKTTFLNALMAEIPDDNRVLTIEDTAELQVAVPNRVCLEANPEITVRMLVRLALRFRPDRIVVGEVRGAESYDLLDALNTGHSGGACTIHADSASLALFRLENLVRMNPDTANLPLTALRQQIASTFRYVVFADRRYGQRGPEEIIEVLGVKDGEYDIRKLFKRHVLH